MDAASNGIVIADACRADCPIIYSNPGFERITGYSQEDILGRNCRLLQGPQTDRNTVRELSAAVASSTECRVTLLNYRKNGEAFWNELFLSPVHDDHGALVQYVGVQNDVSERKRVEGQVQHMAYHDALTGLGNRAKIEGGLEQALHEAAEHEASVALLYLDLDNFKAVNDNHGHRAGDDLLRQAADRLRRACRPGDVLSRQGGDEFLILLPRLDTHPEKTASAVAERVAQTLREPFDVIGQEVTVGASVGVSLYPRDATDADSLLEHADTAMYVAKNGGRGRVSLYVTGQAAPAQRRHGDPPTPTTVREVLDAGAIRTVYQPIVELDNGAVVGYEALSRGPSNSPLERPDLLFSAAREDGLVDELDWACRITALRTADKGGLASPMSVFVNVEPDALALPPPAAVRKSWDDAASKDNVFIEITERALTANPAELLQAVDSVRARGWGVALDDVGADVRSLALMPLLSPDVVKLDLRLIQEQPSIEVAAIVSAVSAYRERTGAMVVAEGIETDAHLKMAYALGATLGQGWLFGRPAELPAKLPWNRKPISVLGTDPPPRGDSPFEVVRAVMPTQQMTKPLLTSISKHLENEALTIGPGAVIVAAFQAADRFTHDTRVRYRALGQRASFVAALGVGMEESPVEGVRGAKIPIDDVLVGEWSIAVLGPHFAGALVAQDLGDGGPDEERRFDFAVTYDRGLVVSAVKSLMRRVTS